MNKSVFEIVMLIGLFSLIEALGIIMFFGALKKKPILKRFADFALYEHDFYGLRGKVTEEHIYGFYIICGLAFIFVSTLGLYMIISEII